MGFWRNLIGQGEKWQVLKASASQLASIGGSGLAGLGGGGTGSSVSLSGIGMGMQSMGATSRGCEEIEARGKYVRTGDAILLQTYKSDHLLSLHEALYGPEAKLVFRDRAGLGSEVWQVEQFNSVGLPAWYLNRPYLRYASFLALFLNAAETPRYIYAVLPSYLTRVFVPTFYFSGQYLVLPTAMKTPSLDIQARAFPHAALMMQQQQASSSFTPAPLNTLSPQTQQFLLMRDLLQVLAGVEGQYIRVAAAPATSTGVEGTGNGDSSQSVLERRRMGASATLQRGAQGQGAGSAGSGAAGLPKVSETHFLIDLDSADRSAANQVSECILYFCQ